MSASNWSIPLPEPLTWPNFVRHERNEHGTPRTVLTCTSCGGDFTMTPALTMAKVPELGCGDYECDSYDINRDVLMMVALGEYELHVDPKTGEDS